MDTKTINPSSSENKKSEKSNIGSTVFSGLAGAAAGVGASMAHDAFGQPAEEPVHPVEPDPVPHVTPEPEQPVAPVEPEVAEPHEPNVPGHQDPKEAIYPDEPFSDPTVSSSGATGEETGPVASAEIVDVDEVVDDIIAIEEIDPNDIEMENLLTFEDVGVIYTEDGGVYNVALLNDGYGDDFVLVDIDGDLYFDVLTDTDFNYIADVDNLLTVADVESELMGGEEYLASDDTTTEAIDNIDLTTDITT